MKFSVLFLILILIISPCFCATQSYSKDSPAELPVRWDLSAIADYYVAEFGFGSRDQKIENITLKTDSYTEGNAFTASATVDIWWNITAPTKVTVYLLPGSALSTGSGNGISWTVSWNTEDFKITDGSDIVSVSEGPASSGSTSKSTVITHDGVPASASSSGAVKNITLRTGDAFHNLPGEYKSTLTLGVEVI